MSVFKFASAGNLAVESSEDEATTKTVYETADTWPSGGSSGLREMPRTGGTYVRFRDVTNNNTTGWLSFKGNVSPWLYHVRDTGGFWNIQVQPYLNHDGTLIDPVPQSTTP